MLTFFSGIWGKVAAAGAAVLAVVFVIWRIFVRGEKAGVAKAREQQRKAADQAKARMDAAKEVKGEADTIRDLDSGKF